MKTASAITCNYFIARENCRKGCICNKERTIYTISNVIWEYNQRKLLESRFLLTEAEKDEVIQKQLFCNLKQAIFDSGSGIHNSSQRFPLVFQVSFIDPTSDISFVYELCEECWILYNNHKGKLHFYFKVHFKFILELLILELLILYPRFKDI